MREEPRLYAAVYGALLLLLGLSILAARLDLGAWNAYLALAIAWAMATLVLLFFTRLAKSDRLDAVVLATGLLMLIGVLFGLTTDGRGFWASRYFINNGGASTDGAQYTVRH